MITKGAPPAASSSNVSTAPAPGASVDPVPVPVPQFVAEPTPTGFIDSFGRYLRRLGAQITLPLVVLAWMATAAGIGRKDASVLLPLVWIILFLVELSALEYVIPRLAIYTIPPICLLAATLARGGNRALRVVAIGLVIAGVVNQTTVAARIVPLGARGYEEAARFVLDRAPGDAVLFSGATDNGGTSFSSSRKHDVDRRLVVLRADKPLNPMLCMGIRER